MKSAITLSLATVLLVGGLNASEEQIADVLQGRNGPVQNHVIPIRQQRAMNALVQQNAEESARESANRKSFSGTVTAAEIERGIDDAIRFLRNRQAADGSMEESLIHYSRGAGTVMATLAMLASGADPASNSSLRRALDWLKKNDEENTYYRAVRANVWEYALRKAPYDDELREKLQEDAEWLTKALNTKEGWRYMMTSSDWDNSVTQYGVLGMWAVARAGLAPDAEFWPRMSRHFRGCQNEDGGWGYQSGSSSANMATAGLATMFLVFDMYHGKDFYTAEKPRVFSGGEAADCLDAISRGMTWLGEHGGDNSDGYYLYGIERTGVASGRKYIGGRDWFWEGVQNVLKAQQGDGAIPMSGYGKRQVNTAFCSLFMVYGGAPVAFNKLEYGKDQKWNLNPRDLANLTKHLWSAYERPLNWHSLSIDSPAQEFEAPVLFISGTGTPDFSPEQVARLRTYVERGGTILAEATDHDEEFNASMHALLRNMFSEKEYPRYGFEPLAAGHGVYTALRQEWQAPPRMKGASDGSRTFFFLSQDYMSAQWQVNNIESDAFKFAMNLLFYTTDLGALKGKYTSIIPDTAPAAKRPTTLQVARGIYNGGNEHPRDGHAASMLFEVLSPYVAHTSGVTLHEAPPAAIAEGIAATTGVVTLTGRGDFNPTKAERRALTAFVESGGTIIVAPYAGAKLFRDSARKSLEAMFGPLTPLPDTHILASGHFAGGADLQERIAFTLPARRALRAEGASTSGQKLLVSMRGNRPAVIFSEFDLMAAASGIANYQAFGYKPESARKILSNILAYAALD